MFELLIRLDAVDMWPVMAAGGFIAGICLTQGLHLIRGSARRRR